jgi:hypothetical protein
MSFVSNDSKSYAPGRLNLGIGAFFVNLFLIVTKMAMTRNIIMAKVPI